MPWMLFVLFGEEVTLLPKTCPLAALQRIQGASALGHPFRRTCASLPSWEEDGGSGRRNLCLRHSANSRRISVAVTQRAPETPLPVLLRPKQRGVHSILLAGRRAAAMAWCCVHPKRSNSSGSWGIDQSSSHPGKTWDYGRDRRSLPEQQGVRSPYP